MELKLSYPELNNFIPLFIQFVNTKDKSNIKTVSKLISAFQIEVINVNEICIYPHLTTFRFPSLLCKGNFPIRY